MKLLFRGKTFCSDDLEKSFRDLLIGTKIITHKLKFEYNLELTKFC